MNHANVITELRKEHELFLNKLEKLSGSLLEDGYFENLQNLSLFRTEFLQLSHEVSLNHHEKEERLFEQLLGHNKINHGGPRCDFFMQQRMTDNFTDKIKHWWAQYPELSLPEDHLLSQSRKMGSALSIPLEEHQSLKMLVKMLSFEVGLQMQETSKERAEKIKTLFVIYKNLLKNHIDKENNCLFLMLERLTA